MLQQLRLRIEIYDSGGKTKAIPKGTKVQSPNVVKLHRSYTQSKITIDVYEQNFYYYLYMIFWTFVCFQIKPTAYNYHGTVAICFFLCFQKIHTSIVCLLEDFYVGG